MNLKKVNLNNLLNDKKKESFYNIYIELPNGKKLQYGRDEYNNYEVLIGLKEKKIDHVWLDEDSYERYKIRKTIQFEDIKYNDIKEKQKVIEEFVKDKELLANVLSDVAILDNEKISFIENVKNKNINFIKNIESLGSLFELYQKNNNHSIIKKQMEIYLITNILYKINKFSEERINDFIKGLILSDLLLNEEEYWTAQKGEGLKFNKKLLHHGDDLLKKIPTQTLPAFVIAFIKDHHEKPDGSGYPKRKKCHELNFFTAFYIIIEDFVSEMLLNKCKTNRYSEIINNIKIKYEKYLDTEFENALDVFLDNLDGKYVEQFGGHNE